MVELELQFWNDKIWQTRKKVHADFQVPCFLVLKDKLITENFVKLRSIMLLSQKEHPKDGLGNFVLFLGLLKEQLTNELLCSHYADLISDSSKTNKEANEKAFNFEVYKEKKHIQKY